MFRCALTVAAVALLTHQAVAQPVAVGKITGNGKKYEVQLTAEQIAGKQTVAVWYPSPTKGNMAEVFTLSVDGPIGLSITAAASKPRKSMATAFNSMRSWWSVPFMLSNGKSKNALTITADGEQVDTSNPSDPWSGDGLCAKLKSAFPQIRKLLELYLHRTFSDQEICDFLKSRGMNSQDPNNTPPTAPTAGHVEATGLLYKDTCSSPTAYPVRFDFALKGVDPSLYPQGTTVTVQATTLKFKGKRSAKLKRESDGKFKPDPIFLSAGIYFYGDLLKIVKHGSSGPKVLVTTEVAKTVSRFGTTYDVFAHIKGALHGGKASFVAQNGEYAYSTCFRLVRENQTANGYR